MKFDTVIIGGGLAGYTAAKTLIERGLRCAVITEGRSLKDVPLRSLPCSLFVGDRVLSADVEDGRVLALHTLRLEDEPLEADNYILATGKFFSKGLLVDMNRIYEPIFGLDLEADQDRAKWFSTDFCADQLFLHFGVKNYGGGRVALDGVMLKNLFAAGELLSDISGIEEDADDRIRKSAAEAAANIR